jgi:hypothetical protein
MTLQRETTLEADVARVRQIVLDDLWKAERTLIDQTAVPDPERAGDLSAIRAAIAQLLRLMS